MLRIYLLSACIFSGNVFAETVVCDKPTDADEPFHSIEISPLEISNVLQATFSKGPQTVIENVRLTQKPGYVFYKDTNHSGSFSLTLVPSTPGMYQGTLVLNARTWFEETIPGFNCKIQFKTNETLPRCSSDQRKLDRDLIDAAQNKYPDDVEDLLNCGANADFRDSMGCSSLLYVTDMRCGERPIDDDLEDPTLYGGIGESTSRDSLQNLVDRLFDGGAVVDIRDPIFNRTPLINVVRNRESSVIKTFIDMEADVNAQDSWGNTALMYAASSGDSSSVWNLLDASPDLTKKNKRGLTAYDISKELAYDDLLPLLAPAALTVTIEGMPDGSCSPLSINLIKGQANAIELHATGKMFLVKSPGLDISELMAGASDTARLVISPDRAGDYAFTCQVHGGGFQPNVGSFHVQ